MRLQARVVIGSMIAILGTGMTPLVSPQPRASSAEGVALLHKVQDALGGAARIAAVRDFEETLRAEAWDASGTPLGEVRKRTRWIQDPNVLRLDQRGPRGTYVMYYEGASAG